jgi:hypothetical protein
MAASASVLQQGQRIPNRLVWEVEALIASALALAEADSRRWVPAPQGAAPLDAAAVLARLGSAAEDDYLAALIELESISAALRGSLC